MTALHDTDDLTCPRCGASVAGESGFEGTVSTEENIRLPIDCPDCDTPLDIVITSAQPEALGVDIFVEDRRSTGTD